MGGVKSVSTQAKLKALYLIWAGEKIAQVARDCGISRQVIYTWKKKAEGALCEALEEKRRGPKVRSSPPKKEVQKDAGNFSKPFKRIEQVQQEVKTPRENSNSHDTIQAPANEKKPERCPICGCEKIYKNGTYIKKIQDNGLKKRQVVQRYICVWCKSSLH